MRNPILATTTITTTGVPQPVVAADASTVGQATLKALASNVADIVLSATANGAGTAALAAGEPCWFNGVDLKLLLITGTAGDKVRVIGNSLGPI